MFFIVPDEVKDLKITPVDGSETKELKVSWGRPNGGVESYNVSLMCCFLNE